MINDGSWEEREKWGLIRTINAESGGREREMGVNPNNLTKKLLKCISSFNIKFYFKSATVNVILPPVLFTSMVPPCKSTMFFAMASPNPDPPVKVERDFSTR